MLDKALAASCSLTLRQVTSNPPSLGRYLSRIQRAVRFCLPWNPDSVNFRGSGMTGRLTVLALFGVNQKHGGNHGFL
jgi:hypothetical protein